MSASLKQEAARSEMFVSYALFCGEVPMDETVKRESPDATPQQ